MKTQIILNNNSSLISQTDKTWILNNGKGTNQIATEDEAKTLLGYGGTITAKKCITKSRAVTFGADTNKLTSYGTTQLVKYSNIFRSDVVDLGLSVKWAKINLGGKVETDYGNYYQWGATDVHANTYPTDNYYKGNTDLDQAHDIAHIKLGGNWRMPTKDELNELRNLINTWTTINGINGRKFTASNGNYIFFPANGYYRTDSSYWVGSDGNYWSSSVYNNLYAYSLYFSSSNTRLMDYSLRDSGHAVRAVCEY